MRASELRIGNFISNPVDRIFEVRGTTKNAVWIYDEWGPLTITVVKPIPINEEWLIKFGFEKEVIQTGGPAINEDADEWSLNGYCFMFDVYNKLFLTGYNWNTKHMEHVHQLQNLYFALTGNELEIKIK